MYGTVKTGTYRRERHRRYLEMASLANTDAYAAKLFDESGALAAVRLDQPLADGEPEAYAGGRAAAGVGVRVLPEQVRPPLGRHPAPLVGDRHGDVRVLAHVRHPDRGRLGRVPRGVRQEFVEHLHDAVAVGHHGGQPRRQVDEDGVPAAAAQEGAARPVDQRGHLGGFGGDRERARLDAPGIEQVADEPRACGWPARR